MSSSPASCVPPLAPTSRRQFQELPPAASVSFTKPMDMPFATYRPQYDPYRLMEQRHDYNAFLNDAAALSIEGADGQQWKFADWSLDSSARRIFLDPRECSRVTYATRQSGRELTMHDSPDAIWSSLVREVRGSDSASGLSSWDMYQRLHSQRAKEIYDQFFQERSIQAFGYSTQAVTSGRTS